MTRLRKFLILSLFVCLVTTFAGSTESYAQELSGEQTSAESGMKDENPQRLEEVTGMDQTGEIFEVGDEAAMVEDGGIAAYSRSTPIYVVNFRTKGNAVTNYKEYKTGNPGYTNGAYGADAAYLGTYGNKVRFMLSGVVGEVDANDVQVVPLSSAKVVSCYKVSGGRLLHHIAQDITTPGWATKLDNGQAPSYLQEGVTYYSYDGHYFYTDYGTMCADYQGDNRSNSVNATSPYYNYYQYLPFRSTSSYSADELNAILGARTSSSSKMKNTGSAFVDNQNMYGVNALIMTGIAANESGWGTSNICQTKNNLFGLNAVDSSPGTSASTYASVEECIRQFADGWMSRGYLDPTDGRYRGGYLGNKGSGLNLKYASDPYWGERAANIIYKLDQDGGSRDSGKYTIGIKDTLATSHVSVNVRNASNTSSNILYKTTGSSNYAVLILNPNAENGFYRIQSDGVLNGDRSALNTATGQYDFTNMYAYISGDYVMVANNGTTVVPPVEEPEVKKELQSIYISSAPVKCTYTEGETFDITGMVVNAKWSDGTETDVTAEVTYLADALQVGTTSVELSYTSEGITQTTTQAITVNANVAVSEVVISPAEVELKAGEEFTFGATVVGIGNPAQTVTWSVEGNSSTETKISDNGSLQVGSDETATKLTVRAVSTVDGSKGATAAVTVAKVEQPEQPETPEESDVTSRLEDQESGIWVSGKLAQGTTFKVETLSGESEGYTEYIEPVKNNTILGVYDIHLSENLSNDESVQLGFTVDEKHNGKKAIILHYKTSEEDGKQRMETYHAEVNDGKVMIEVSGFSPYVIALDDATVDLNPPTDSNTSSTPETPQTPTDQTSTSKPIITDTDKNTEVTDTKSPSASAKTVDDKKIGSPKTGDENQIVMWSMVMTLAVAAMVLAMMKRRQRV